MKTIPMTAKEAAAYLRQVEDMADEHVASERYFKTRMPPDMVRAFHRVMRTSFIVGALTATAMLSPMATTWVTDPWLIRNKLQPPKSRNTN